MALHAQNIYVVNIGEDQQKYISELESERLSLYSAPVKVAEQHVILVINLTPNEAREILNPMLNILRHLGCAVTKTVKVTIFETHSLPPTWLPALNEFDAVIVPSQFNQQTFTYAAYSKENTYVVPYAIDHSQFYPNHRTRKSYHNIGYLFGLSHRKGVELLLEAYTIAFTDRDDTLLTLKSTTHVGSGGITLLSNIKEFLVRRFGKTQLNHLPRISIEIGPTTNDQLRDFYWSLDLYVSTDRATGWGMPTMEAMACGKLVSAIDYGGGTTFLHTWNGYPIPTTGRLVPVDGRLLDAAPIYAGQQWEETTATALAETMTSALVDSSHQEKRAAALEATRHFSFTTVGLQLLNCLESIGT
ncbi:glycosyltransferase family 4 protein [Ferrimicrobium sp.]|uniref:glycosyltransferase family 4 protein n=1 Tax=Ferrimicrobium sp. TaxID=2926050 RepID=UPI002625902D|nr:glycosyltransferase family 4 protein [Ferrimicrobium sp.]